MFKGKHLASIILPAAFAVAAAITTTPAAAQTETILHSFHQDGTDGTAPIGGVIFDASGNLYGTTSTGGAVKYGIVFELTPVGGGSWNEKVVHTFIHTDGHAPFGGLSFDAAGHLYGTTSAGGVYNNGAVFELIPNARGNWGERVLRNFNREGQGSWGDLVSDSSGNLYGVTGAGGAYGSGSVFELIPQASGTWSEKVLHSFGSGMDGAYPYLGVILDTAGNVYGTTAFGGAQGRGTVFEIAHASGAWIEKVLHSFTPQGAIDGDEPEGRLIFDAVGNLYGTTGSGGTGGWGTVFELTRNAGGTWTEQLLHSFTSTDGAGPFAGLTFDAHGNLYGTTASGGTGGRGTLFELQPALGGGWTQKVLHNFSNDGTDGYTPYAGVILDAAGNLYGTTSAGGTYNHGTVYEVTP
jgi:uncharacterized repeat protein (TIGR03803 family)